MRFTSLIAVSSLVITLGVFQVSAVQEDVTLATFENNSPMINLVRRADPETETEGASKDADTAQVEQVQPAEVAKENPEVAEASNDNQVMPADRDSRESNSNEGNASDGKDKGASEAAAKDTVKSAEVGSNKAGKTKGAKKQGKAHKSSKKGGASKGSKGPKAMKASKGSVRQAGMEPMGDSMANMRGEENTNMHGMRTSGRGNRAHAQGRPVRTSSYGRSAHGGGKRLRNSNARAMGSGRSRKVRQASVGGTKTGAKKGGMLGGGLLKGVTGGLLR